MIKINLNKAKDICHAKRRDVRAKEFAPLDIEATIPSMAEQAEQKRQEIRVKYAKIQADIDSAKDADTLKTIYSELE